MNEKNIKDILRTFGIPISIMVFILLIASVFYMYTKYLENKKLKLETIKLEQQITGTSKCC